MTAVEIVWTIGLIGILIPTLIVLKQVALILGVLRDIHRLGEITLQAALGIRQHLVPLSALPSLAGPLAVVRDSTAQIAVTAESLAGRLPLGKRA